VSDLIIDVPLLACPNPATYSQEDFQDVFISYLTALSDVSDLRSSFKSVRLWRDRDLPEILELEGAYPFHHSLATAFGSLFDDMDFQLEDASTLATSLLGKSSCFEDEGDISDVLVSGCKVGADAIIGRSNLSIDHLCRQICLALPIVGDGKTFNKNTYLASNIFGKPNDVTIDYVLEMTERNDLIAEPRTSATVKIPSYRGSDSFLDEVDLAVWWKSGLEYSEIDSCCVCIVKQHTDMLERVDAIRSKLTLGTQFLHTAQALGFAHDPKKINRLLRVVSDLGVDRNLDQSHWLRKGKGANEPQRARGDWRAWRHDIDDEFHLHYWRKGECIELANVVVHGDFSIS
jgi:hypothetical protein